MLSNGVIDNLLTQLNSGYNVAKGLNCTNHIYAILSILCIKSFPPIPPPAEQPRPDPYWIGVRKDVTSHAVADFTNLDDGSPFFVSSANSFFIYQNSRVCLVAWYYYSSATKPEISNQRMCGTTAKYICEFHLDPAALVVPQDPAVVPPLVLRVGDFMVAGSKARYVYIGTLTCICCLLA